MIVVVIFGVVCLVTIVGVVTTGLVLLRRRLEGIMTAEGGVKWKRSIAYTAGGGK